MKRFWSLFFQDLLLSYRSGHILLTAVLLAGMIALVLFLPRQIRVHNELILDASPAGELATFLEERGVGAGVVYLSESGFQDALQRQPNKVGVVYTGSAERPQFEIVAASTVAPQNLSLLEASLAQAAALMRGQAAPGIPVEFLRDPAPPPPFNLRFVPVMIVFEVVLLGFFIAAVLLFQEKQEGTIRAYRVTPAGTMAYLLSKNALFVVLSLAYGLPVLLVAFGLRANYPLLALLLALSSSVMILFSLAVAVFFRNLSEWFFVGVGILVLNSLPMLSYSLPSFAPAWMTWIPSYHSVFAVRDVLFYGASWGSVSSSLVYLAALNLLALAAAYAAVRFKLLKEGR